MESFTAFTADPLKAGNGPSGFEITILIPGRYAALLSRISQFSFPVNLSKAGFSLAH
ncbi:MAG: hypothetical protein WD139_07985 [Balneolaceae bacterium]